MNFEIVYLSGPITKNQNASRSFSGMQRLLERRRAKVLNPMDIPPPTPDAKGSDWQYYMRQAVAMMMDADKVIMLEGWRGSKGAIIEYRLAKSLDIPVEDEKGTSL